jgi:O-antigen ligase
MPAERLDLAPRAGEAALCIFAAALPLSIAGANIGWGLLAAALLAMAYTRTPIDWQARKTAIEKPLYGFLAAAIICDALGVAPAHSFKFLNQDIHKVWLYLLLVIGLSSIPSKRPLYALAAGFAIAALIGIFQAVPSFFVEGYSSERIRAHAFMHPVTYGQLMSAGVIGAILFALEPPPAMGKHTRLAASLLALIFSMALLLSNTRGAILAAGGALYCIGWTVARYRRLALWTLPIAFIVILGVEASRPDRSLIAELAGLREPDYATAGQTMRITLWRAAWQMGTDHPLTGVGHNNFRAQFPTYIQTRLDGGSNSFGTAHNLYIHHFAERGLLGLGALFALLWAMTARAWQRVRQRSDAWQLWGLGCTVAFLIMNFTEVALQVEIVWMTFFFIWILAETQFREAQKHAE